MRREGIPKAKKDKPVRWEENPESVEGHKDQGNTVVKDKRESNEVKADKERDDCWFHEVCW